MSDNNEVTCAYCSPDAYERVLMISGTGATNYDYKVKFDPKDRAFKLLYDDHSPYSSGKDTVRDKLPILYCPFCRRKL